MDLHDSPFAQIWSDCNSAVQQMKPSPCRHTEFSHTRSRAHSSRQEELYPGIGVPSAFVHTWLRDNLIYPHIHFYNTLQSPFSMSQTAFLLIHVGVTIPSIEPTLHCSPVVAILLPQKQSLPKKTI